MAVTKQTQEGVATVPAAESAAMDHQAWRTDIIRWGTQGVNLFKLIDALEPTELARLTNGVPQAGGGIATRPGLTARIYAGAKAHSMQRLNNPGAATSNLFEGIDSTLYMGDSGGPTPIASGFSGNPLSFVTWGSEYSGEDAWLYVADTATMVKANLTTGALPIGLPKAGQPSSVAADTALITTIADFGASDGSEAANWTPIAGEDSKGNASFPPTIYDANGITGPAVNMALSEGAAGDGYFSGMSLSKALDLTQLPGPVTSDDQDLIHFSLRINEPSSVQEVRLYFVVGAFTAGVIPGMVAGQNTSAYCQAFRSSDFSQFVVQATTAVDAASQQRSAAITSLQHLAANNQRIREGVNRTIANLQAKNAAALAQQQRTAQAVFQPLVGNPADAISSATLAGSDVWTSYGAQDLPLRKSDFLKIGNAGSDGLGWANISGIVITVLTNAAVPVTCGFCEAWLQGGYEPDTSEPDAQPYDYRVVNVDSRTGARSNPSDVMYQADGKTVNGLYVSRGRVVIQPQAYGDGAVYQEVYRRGGSLTDTWYGPVADNKDTGDGSQILDTTSDITAVATGTVEVDHDQPVTTADAAGNAVYGAPLGFLVGPMGGYLFGGGDAYRPGDIYWSKPGEPDHWPAANHQEVCPPSETLMNGGMYGGQAFVFSRERMYALQVGYQGSISSNPTDCAQGLVGRWAMAIGPGGVFFVSRDAVRVTLGGTSSTLSDPLRPLFHGETKNGYYPIDFTQPDRIRLAIHGDDLWFGYQDTQGSRIWWVYSLILKTWRCVMFAQAVEAVYSDPRISGGLRLLCGSTSAGKVWEHTGVDDDGTAFTVDARMGAAYAQAREEKLFGDVAVYGDLQGLTLTATVRVNGDAVTDTPVTVAGSAGYREYLLHPFGTVPQHGSSIGLELSWPSGAVSPAVVTQVGLATVPQPEITMLRATTWQPLNTSGEAYLYGCWIDADTFGNAISVVVEGLRGGTPVTLATLTINSNAGRRKWYDWSAQNVDMVRLRPATECGAWMLFGQGWLTRPEPPRLPGMDSGFENLGDTYYTGLDLEIDTFGVPKTVIVTVDGVVLSDPATSLPYWTITANGRSLRHITLPWGRGHIYRFYSTDAVPVLQYSHKWWVEGEPSEQANWNQNFTIAGTKGDKWVKGILLECDTFGQTKRVNVEVDGVAVPSGPFDVNTNGRKVVQIAFPQVLGRVLRIFPADNFPGRLYSAGWLFDQEPYCLTRFETQEIRLDIDDWKVLTYGQITYKGTAEITVTVQVYGQDGTLLASDAYTMPARAAKSMWVFRPLSRKGVLYKFVFTSSEGFWLYREESWVAIQAWAGGNQQKLKPFGNDDLDATRGMMDAGLAAARPGGTA